MNLLRLNTVVVLPRNVVLGIIIGDLLLYTLEKRYVFSSL